MAKDIIISKNILDSSRLHATVMFARHKDKWVLVRAANSSTWEFPGGHIEPNENIYDCARRELFEETGAIDYILEPICLYSHKMEDENRTTYAFYAAIQSFVDLPKHEIVEAAFFDEIPINLTYPEKYESLLPLVYEYLSKQDQNNIYEHPTRYLRELQERFIMPNQVRHEGKSVIVAFFTKVCKAGCPSCFFGSTSNKVAEFPEAQEMSDSGFEKFIHFVNNTNNSYLMISGGGEPFEKPEYVVRTVAEAKTDKIVFVTSAYWAIDIRRCESLLQKIIETQQGRNDNLLVVLRVSLDEFHANKLGTRGIENIIKVCMYKYVDAANFSLQIHTLQNDNSVATLMKIINGKKIPYKDLHNDYSFRKNKNRYIIRVGDNFHVQVEEAKLFYSDRKQQLQNGDEEILRNARKVFFDDLRESQGGNFSTVENENGSIGLDFVINYNCNVTTWGNYHRENVPNLYIHSPQQIINLLYNDLISYSFIDKDFDTRRDIVSEVNSHAADRAVLINIRDYSGSYMLEENKTALYYGVRIIQYYIREGKIKPEHLNRLSNELIQAIMQGKEYNVSLFKQSDYSIFSQLAEHPFPQGIWDDVFELTQLGHYDINKSQLLSAMLYYTSQIKNPRKRPWTHSDQNERLLNKLNPMNAAAARMVRLVSAGLYSTV